MQRIVPDPRLFCDGTAEYFSGIDNAGGCL
jgi:hypothetical protein